MSIQIRKVKSCSFANLLIVTAAMAILTSSVCSAYTNSPVVIDDEQTGATNIVPINLMLLADDSGSMGWTHAPDDIGEIKAACWRGKTPVGGTYLCTPLDEDCRGVDEKLELSMCGYPWRNPLPGSEEDAKEKLAAVLPPPLAWPLSVLPGF